MSEAKPFCISKWEVWEAYKRVKVNQGAAGVDEQSIADFERDLKGNLYKIWNRMSSGSYFPPPVRTVKIPKANGGERKLGIPTVSDRIAQQVVKSRLEPAVDPLFHPDSYGYRPGKSALDAVGQGAQRCWRYDWIVDLDIKGFFDNSTWCTPSDVYGISRFNCADSSVGGVGGWRRSATHCSTSAPRRIQGAAPPPLRRRQLLHPNQPQNTGRRDAEGRSGITDRHLAAGLPLSLTVNRNRMVVAQRADALCSPSLLVCR